MRIVFNGKGCGFGNNGGSHTLIQSAKYLAKLGAHVTLYGVYKYTWEEKPDGVRIIPHGKIPTCDVIVATGQSTVPSTLAHKRCLKRYWWVRGHETWSTSEKQLIKYYKSIPCLVNSEWMQGYIEKRTGNKPKIQYQGVDFNLWADEKPWSEREIEIGGLYSTRHKTKNHYLLEELEKEYGYKVKLLNRDIKDPSYEGLKNWYNNIKFWVSTSTLEGFHNPPVEAAMCGCFLIATDHPWGGTSDYATKYRNSLFFRNEKGADAIDGAIKFCLSKDHGIPASVQSLLKQDIREKIGSREENMKKMLEIFKL